MNINVRNKPNLRVIDIKGEVNFNTSAELLRQLTVALEGAIGTVAVNLEGVKFMDSSGIATMLETMKLARAKELKFALIKMNENLRNIFVMSRLDQVFTIVDDESVLENS